jgi:hypothetical protein
MGAVLLGIETPRDMAAAIIGIVILAAIALRERWGVDTSRAIGLNRGAKHSHVTLAPAAKGRGCSLPNAATKV